MPDTPEPYSDEQRESLRQKLEAARRELLETSTRTRLLSTPLESPRAKLIEVVDELSEEVFRILVEEGRSMTFTPTREDDLNRPGIAGDSKS